MAVIPIEIQTEILHLIEDPVQLLKLRAVCKDWCSIIDRDLERTNKFRQWCEKTMSTTCIQQILDITFPKIVHTNYLTSSFYDSLSSNVWKGIIETYHKCHGIMSKIPIIDVTAVQCPQSPVTGSVSGHIGAFLTLYGELGFYDIQQCPPKLLYVHDFEDGQPMDVKLWHTRNRLVAVIKFAKDGVLRFLDVVNRKLLKSRNKVPTTFFTIHQNQCWSYDEEMFRLTQYFFAPKDIRRRHYYIQMPTFALCESMYFKMSGDQFIIHVFSEGYLDILSYNIRDSLERERKQSTILEPKHSWNVFCGGNVVGDKYREYYDVAHGVFFIWTDKSLAVAVNNGKWALYHDAYLDFHGRIASVTMHCNLVIIGLSRARLVVFEINSPVDLMSLNFSTIPLQVITLDEDSSKSGAIESVNVTQLNGRLTIVGKSSEKIYVATIRDYLECNCLKNTQ